MTKLDIAIQYCFTLVNIPYRWGGDDPIAGFDCSGGVQEILAVMGVDPPGDQTAHDLYLTFKRYRVKDEIHAGCLIFYGKESRITHVGFSIGDGVMFEFGGGGSATKTEGEAIVQNAYGRLRPINRRKDFVCACDVIKAIR